MPRPLTLKALDMLTNPLKNYIMQLIREDKVNLRKGGQLLDNLEEIHISIAKGVIEG